MAETAVVGPRAEFMRRAIELATENVRRGNGGPFAAVIVRGEEVIAEAANSVTTTHDPTAHGEVNAIRAACRKLGDFSLAGCVIYSSCEPCPMCLAAIYWARLDGLYFGSGQRDAAKAGFDDAFLYEEVGKPLGARAIPTEQMMAEEAWSSFAAWLESASRVDY